MERGCRVAARKKSSRQPWIAGLRRLPTWTPVWSCGFSRTGADRQGHVAQARPEMAGDAQAPRPGTRKRAQIRPGFRLADGGNPSCHCIITKVSVADVQVQTQLEQRTRGELSTRSCRIPLAGRAQPGLQEDSAEGTRQQRSGYPRLRGALDRSRALDVQRCRISTTWG